MRLGLAVAVAVALFAAVLHAPAAEQRARHLHSYSWHLNKPWFGGFSGIEVSPDGQTAAILGDRSHLVHVRLGRAGGRISSVRPFRLTQLKSSSGAVLKGRIVDSEGLAAGPRGSFFVSFEGVHRVARYDHPGDRAHVLTTAPLFRGLGQNRSLEALARDRHGRLYALPEGHDANGRIPVFANTGPRWDVAFYLPARGDFLPVGADFGPDGRLYVLERDVGFIGFRSRLRRWTMTAGKPTNEETLFQTSAGTHDNLEGVSVWRDGNGQLRAIMISDDNFLPLQRTELVEYLLPN